MNIQDRLKAGSVKRWNIVETTRQQTLAEHLFNVSMIAGEIAKKIPTVPVTTVVARALVHDLAEVILGDIPTPTKARMREMGFDFKKLEHSVFPLADADPGVEKIVKIADVMEAWWFIKNHGQGRHASMVERRMWKDLTNRILQSHPTLREAADEVLGDMQHGEIEI